MAAPLKNANAAQSEERYTKLVQALVPESHKIRIAAMCDKAMISEGEYIRRLIAADFKLIDALVD